MTFDEPQLVVPRSDDRCCVLNEAKRQCPGRAAFWVGQNSIDDYTHVCGAHVPDVLRDGDRVYHLNSDGSIGEAADVYNKEKER